MAAPDHEVVIVGAGFGGIGAGIKLKQAGIHDFVIVEQAADIGGTWRDNTYPGVAVDVSSFTYSFSFEPNPYWSRSYAPGRELKKYADRCVDKYGLRPHLRLNTQVVHSEFDEIDHLWRAKLADGSVVRARYVIAAVGGLTQPKLPDIPGVGEFAGKTVHTARWDHDHDLTGQRVAIIGTGATAVQVVPSIAPITDRLHVFQRTPIWCAPKPDVPLPRPLQAVFRYVPGIQLSVRAMTTALTEAVMTLGVVHNKELPLLVKAIDTLILATGFKVFETGNTPPFPIVGTGGQELGDFWDERRYQSYHGASVPFVPNVFTIIGPYGFTGGSYFQLIENQTRHALRCITEARRRGATSVAVKQEAHDRYFARVQRRAPSTVFFNNDCGGAHSYYFDKNGDAPLLRPDSALTAWWDSWRFSLDDYEYRGVAEES